MLTSLGMPEGWLLQPFLALRHHLQSCLQPMQAQLCCLRTLQLTKLLGLMLKPVQLWGVGAGPEKVPDLGGGTALGLVLAPDHSPRTALTSCLATHNKVCSILLRIHLGECPSASAVTCTGTSIELCLEMFPIILCHITTY